MHFAPPAGRVGSGGQGRAVLETGREAAGGHAPRGGVPRRGGRDSHQACQDGAAGEGEGGAAGEATLLPRLLAAARERAPRVSFTVRPLDVDDAEHQLRRGDLDAFVATPVLTSHRTVRIPLFHERYVGMVAADHPRVRGESVTMPELEAEMHATVFGPSGHVVPRAVLASHGLLDRVAVDATRFSMLPYLLEQTDLIAVVPEYVGEVFTASHRVRLVRLPFDTEPIEVALYPRHESSRSPSQRWLVRFMTEVLGERVSPAQLPPYADRVH
ncbi:LysR substrate-binding domain-containing protein [Streptomyces anandii]|uniref:LysR substrate-binding domain-containing protein n=1 Tax=Streptomyces anandii TaxID=285454 RepID=UPI00368785B0